MSINKQEALKRLDALDEEAKKLRAIIDAPEKITDRIKSFEDACGILGISVSSVLNGYDTTDEAAYKKLKVIVKALNEGWTPDWDNGNQKKWYPYFDMRSGFSFGGTAYTNWYTLDGVGSRLCLKNEELARYAGNQFLGLYKEFLK